MHHPGVNAKNKIYFWERIAFRISLGFTLPVIVSAYALFTVSNAFSELSESKERIQLTWAGVHLNEGKALLALTKIRMSALAIQTEGTPENIRQLETSTREFRGHMERSRKSLEALAQDNYSPLDPAMVRSYLQIDEYHSRFGQFAARLIDSLRSQNFAEAGAIRKELDKSAQEAESMIVKLHAQNDLYEQKLATKIQDAEQKTSRTLAFYLMAVFVFGIVAAALVTWSITSPVRKLLVRIRDIATGDGDLTKRVSTRGGGEVGQLALWMNIFLDKTHSIIATIANASSVVSQTTDQVGTHTTLMTKATAGINDNLMEQAINVDECTARVGSIDDLIQNSGESTRQAASLSRIAMDRALQGGASVHETIEAMEKIEESARKVEELVISINEIGSQTNLLAINAAIEATKAGEHGKGFAVVAEEIRRLAERARKLTSQVTVLTGESSTRVKAGVGLARAAGVSLDGIIKDVEAVSSLIQRIASGAAKQTESSTVVLDFMRKVSESVRANLNEMENVTNASQVTTHEVSKLDSLVNQLNEVVGQFRLAMTEEEMAARSELSSPSIQAPPRFDIMADPLNDPESTLEMNLAAMMNPAMPPIPSMPTAKLIVPIPALPPKRNPPEEGEGNVA